MNLPTPDVAYVAHSERGFQARREHMIGVRFAHMHSAKRNTSHVTCVVRAITFGCVFPRTEFAVNRLFQSIAGTA